MKFTKLITAVPAKINKITKNTSIWLLRPKINIFFINWDLKTKIITVEIWIKYLKVAGMPFLSSRKPISASGKLIRGIQKFMKQEDTILIKTKVIPPPVGTGNEWELLKFGLSKKSLESMGIAYFKENNEIKKLTKAII